MKNIFYTLCAASLLVLSSCEDALDTKSYTNADTSNYPAKATDAAQLIAGIYNTLNVAGATPQTSFYYAAALASDDQLGGGGDNDVLMQAEDVLCNSGENMTEAFWKVRYQGINRANNAIMYMDNVSGLSDATKNQYLGEAHFMRAFFNYELASMYGNVPYITENDTKNGVDDVAQAPADTIWAHILLDLKQAINLMSDTKWNATTAATTDGHVDKWAAEAMMARAYMFYTGFYRNANPISSADATAATVALPDGTSLTKDDVITWIKDCVNNSGYSLVPTYQNLWAYTNKYSVNDTNNAYMVAMKAAHPDKTYEFVEDDAGVNPESLFKIKFSIFASWDTTIGYANEYALHFGMRGAQAYGNTFPFGQGWGAGPVAPNLWNDWVSYDKSVNGGDGKTFVDPRIEASICNIPKELPNYKKGGWSDYVQETDYYNKKMSPISCYKGLDADGNTTYWPTFEGKMYGGDVANDFQLANMRDITLIRFSDVLLMWSELTGTADGINRVRGRVGLDPIAYTYDNLKNERRWELCFEGTRWNDIRRWGDAAADLEKQTKVPCYHAGNATVNSAQKGGYTARYNATKGFFKIPEGQITQSQYLKQNDGWDASADYSGWVQ